MEKDEFRPTLEDLEKTRLYFAELEDALHHYSSCLPKGRFHTLTTRSDAEGNSQIELVSETRFPPLDDLPEHFKRLRYVAEQLDKLPPSFWEQVYDEHLRGSGRNFPYVPMEITLWGTSNKKQNAFAQQADRYERSLRDFSWSESEDPYLYKDNAEQCFRILAAYLRLYQYIDPS